MKLVPPAPFAIDFLNRVAVLLCVVAVLGGPSSLVAGPGAASPFGGRRVLVIGIDGCRADALRLATNSGLAPHMADLIRNGTVTWNAVAGGPPSPSPSNQPTLSGPGWSSILCGVWTDKHLVTGNTFSPSDFVNYPAFLRRVKEAVPGAFVASAVSWNPIDSGCIGPSQNGSEFMDSRFKGPSSSYLVRDQQVRDQVVSLLNTADPDVIFAHLDQVDDFGHSTGFSKTNPEYMAGIATVDGYVGDILTAMRARPQFAAEDWCVILVTDHGGSSTSHGGQSSDERTIWLIVNGGAATPGRLSGEQPGHTCIPATAMKHLGLPLDPAWGMDATVFAVGAWFDAATADDRVLLKWALPSGIGGATAIEVWRDGVYLTALPVSARDYADTPPAGGGTWNYELRFPGSSQATLTRSVVLAGDLAEALVLALPFDGSVSDVSGRGNTPAEVGGLSTYTTGVRGQAVVVNSSRYLRLGATGALLPDLQFGAGTDFTIALWVKVSGGWSGDPSFISNKNWNSGSNTGWFLGGQTNASTWQWNFKGATLTRRDFDPSGNGINDGQWHHVIAVHKRTGNASLYHDGVLIGTVDIAGAGGVDGTFPVCIGRDGNAGFTWNVNLAIDDLRIWRRALNSAEAASLATEVKGFANWKIDHFTDAQLATASVSGDLADADADGLKTLQEFAFALSPHFAEGGEVLALAKDSSGLEIRYAQRNGGSGTSGVDYRAEGLSYTLEHSADLSPLGWMPVEEAQIEEAHPPVNNGDGTHTVSLRVLPPLNLAPRIFFRLKVGSP